MKFLSISIFSICLFMCGCKQNVGNKLDDLFSKVNHLEYSKVLANNHLWGAPTNILYCDSSIFVFDAKSDNSLFHLVDLTELDSVSVYDFGEKGQGGNEFIMPSDFQIVADTIIGVYDINKQTLHCINTAEIKNQVYHYPVLVKDTISGSMKIIPTIFDTFVTLGIYDDCMFKLWGKNISGVKKYGEFPYRDKDEQQIENRLRGMAYQGCMQANISRDKFIYAAFSAEILYFYRITNNDICLIKKYEFSYPTYKTQVEGGGISAPMASTNNFTFISVCTSDKYVYALYSGKNFKDEGLNSFTGKSVYVFDWNGNPVMKYELNIAASVIAVDNRDDNLYAFSNMPDPTLLKFELK